MVANMFTRRLFVLPMFIIGCCYNPSFTQEPITLRGHKHPIWSVAFSPDGKTLCSGAEDGLIIVWDLAKRCEKFRIDDEDNPLGMAFSKGGDKLFTARTRVKVFDFSTKKSALIYKEINNAGRGVAISPDGQLLATAGNKNTVRIWSLAANKEMAHLTGHIENIGSVAFSPNGKTLASVSYDATVRLWDLNNNREIARFENHHKDYLSPVLFTPDGETLISGAKGKVSLWDLKTKKLRLTLPDDDLRPSLAISPNGKVLATGCNHSVKLWDPITGKKLRCITNPSIAVAVAFSPDNKFLAVAGGNIFDGNDPCEITLSDVSDLTEGKKLKEHR